MLELHVGKATRAMAQSKEYPIRGDRYAHHLRELSVVDFTISA